MMSKRLQVVIDEEEAREFKRCARREGLTLSEWVRRTLRRATRARGRSSPAEKLAALERALQCHHPTGEVEEMIEEIERGRDLR